MSGDHNQYQKDQSYLDDRREDSYVQLVDEGCDRIVWRNQSFRLPIEWVGLTDEEVRDLWSWSASAEAERTANTQQHAFARAIEAKLKEKNHG